jgi:hypothetical protein
MAQTVFVFACGNYYGLSVQADGANLPALPGYSQQWALVQSIAMTERQLQPLVPNTGTAIANLTARGYHLARVLSGLPPIPQSHRHSA